MPEETGSGALPRFARLVKYYSGDQFKKNRIGTAYGTNEKNRNAQIILVGKPEGKRPPRKPTRRWQENVKQYL
jgi:hypothetical protein